MPSLFSHLLLMLAMRSDKMYMPPSFSLCSIVLNKLIVLKSRPAVFTDLIPQTIKRFGKPE